MKLFDQQETYEESGGDFPGALNSLCNSNIGQGSSPVVKSTAAKIKVRL